jgi:hypothetical protein
MIKLHHQILFYILKKAAKYGQKANKYQNFSHINHTRHPSIILGSQRLLQALLMVAIVPVTDTDLLFT